jgi:hypothetical protein
MRRKSILVLCLALVGTLALTAAGCGGGGKEGAAQTTAATETTAPATTAPTTTEAATTEAATTEATTTEATKTSSFSGIASAKNCQDLERLGQKFSTSFSGSSNGADLKKQATLFKEFADKAPSDIRADFQVIADYFSKIAEVAGSLKAGATPDAATIAKLQKISTQVDQKKLTQASQKITAWVQKNCHK